MATFTPGPWTVQRRWSNECEIVPRITCKADDDRLCGWIADCVGAPYLGHKSTLPNAYLIAAAPDLHRELAHLVRLLEPLERDGGLNVPGLATLNGAREALAKALG